jgi:hypothetical protein
MYKKGEEHPGPEGVIGVQAWHGHLFMFCTQDYTYRYNKNVQVTGGGWSLTPVNDGTIRGLGVQGRPSDEEVAGRAIGPPPGMPTFRKPIVYLYNFNPNTEITVRVDLNEDTMDKFTELIPAFNGPKGESVWRVRINGNKGGVTDLSTDIAYPYLFWEATRKIEMHMDCNASWSVQNKHGDLKEMLTTELARRALVPHEIDDFLEYWLEELEKLREPAGPFVSVAFVDISKDAPLTVTSTDDDSPTYIRAFAQFSVSHKQVGKPYVQAEIPATVSSRTGPTVVEWGGVLL